MTPYATAAPAKKGRRRGGGVGMEDDLEGELAGEAQPVDSEEGSDDDVEADAMIKVKVQIRQLRCLAVLLVCSEQFISEVKDNEEFLAQPPEQGLFFFKQVVAQNVI